MPLWKPGIIIIDLKEESVEVLVVGGAGYIGSFVSRLLVERGYKTTVLDNFSLGHRAALDRKICLVEGDLSEKELSFYIERQSPTPESGIKFKELWPFRKGCVFVFRLKRAEDRLKIVSMEMNREDPTKPSTATE